MLEVSLRLDNPPDADTIPVTPRQASPAFNLGLAKGSAAGISVPEEKSKFT